MIEFLLPLLESYGGSAAGLSGSQGLLNALGGGELFGKMAGSTMDNGMQGPTQGSGLFGALSGGGLGALGSLVGAGKKSKPSSYLGAEAGSPSAGYQFSQQRFRPTAY